MSDFLRSAQAKVRRIRASGLSIYDGLADQPDLYFEIAELEAVLDRALRGMLLDYPNRKRSKIVKSAICTALGYPVPPAFKRVKPRFLGQDFDAITQKSDNVQPVNEMVSPSRRYVFIRVDAAHHVTRVRVVTGKTLAAFDRTGTRTHKFQARYIGPATTSTLVSERDSPRVIAEIGARRRRINASEDQPVTPLLPIRDLYERLLPLVGRRFQDPGLAQERNRGGLLHKLVQTTLGDVAFHDSGRFPDVPHQLLELKLQLATTIDLGLVCPDSTEPLAINPSLYHCDVRYGVFYASSDSGHVVLSRLVLVTGEQFFKVFRRFEGNVRNSKLQIPLPRGFFDDAE